MPKVSFADAFDEMFGKTSPFEKGLTGFKQPILKQLEQGRLEADEVKYAQAQKDTEKRRIQEKQIRELRSHYRSSGGFLNSQGLGGEATKLGTG